MLVRGVRYCSTELACAATCVVLGSRVLVRGVRYRSTELAYAATRCVVLGLHMLVLCVRYHSTELAYAATICEQGGARVANCAGANAVAVLALPVQRLGSRV
eukprot:259727-Rhodomonas_salina.1